MRNNSTSFINKYLIPKHLALWLFTILINGNTFSQVTGAVVDAKGDALKYANVGVIKASDSSLVKGISTDANGKFSISAIPAGSYWLSITSIGYAPTKTNIFNYAGNNELHDVSSITLNANVKAMKEVTVNSLRPTIIQLADKMVVSIEGTALAAGNTAFDILTRAPGVFVDQDGNITLNGRGGVTIMLDGKITFLSARELRIMLEAMSAENIKNIEVITNPSAKYDAEGVTGILNINLKKNLRQGMNGSVYTGYNFNGKQHGGSVGGNINYKSGKWNSFLYMDAARRVGGRDATFTRIFYGASRSTYFDQSATGSFINQGPPSLRLGSDFSLNDKHSIGFVANYTLNNSKSDFLTDTYIGNQPKKYFQYINADNFGKSRYENLTLNAHYNAKLDTLGSNFSTDLDYVKIANRRESNFNNFFTDIATNTTTQDFLYTLLPAGYDIYSGKFDITKMLSRGRKLEFGAKASQVTSDNDSRFYFNNAGLELDRTRTNHFNYREQIYAGYANWSSRLSPKLTFQTGLRVEHTASKGKSYTTGEITNRRYTDLFPSLFLQHKLSDNYSVNYNYTRRLSRPNYGSLNPFRFYRDPYTWEQGNPNLRPSYTHSITITQVIKKQYSIILNYQHNLDIMSELPILNTDSATTIYTTGNINNGNYVAMTAVAPLRIMKGWESQNTIIVSYNRLKLLADKSSIINDRVSYYVSTNQTIQLPKSYRIELTVWYRGPGASGLYLQKGVFRTDLGFKKSFLNKKFDLSINISDVFKSHRFQWSTDINGNVNEFDQYFRLRALGINLRYNFSRGVKVEEKKRTAVEEAGRAN